LIFDSNSGARRAVFAGVQGGGASSMQADKARASRLPVRGLLCLSVGALLSACASQQVATTAAPQLTATQEAAVYKSHAHANYAPPGTPDDPWGPYVVEASSRFDVPPVWIREVMHVESGGYQYRANGTLTTSPVGAMGLMQLMPATYDEMRARYGLGDDAFEPHNNILAGTAYLREMYDQFGTPGFLAAYNAGPARLSDYLNNHRPLPDETRRYVYMIGSRIGGAYPQSRSPAEQMALNQISISIPAGPRYGYARHTVMLSSRGHGRHEARVVLAAYAPAAHGRHGGYHVTPAQQAPVEVAEAPEPRHAAAARVAVASAAPHAGHGLHLIEPAMAAENMRMGGRDWSVQIGAYGNSQQAQAAAGAARGAVGHSSTLVAAVHSGHATLYRARLGGLTHDAAMQACHRLAHKGGNCLLVAPAAQ
jgi:hypothetical protein